MASPTFAPEPLSCKRISLAEIDAVVSARLGATRSLGNAQPACFNRQVAMYLAARIGRWSTTAGGSTTVVTTLPSVTVFSGLSHYETQILTLILCSPN